MRTVLKCPFNSACIVVFRAHILADSTTDRPYNVMTATLA